MAKNWAICVGINQYRFLQDLTCAVNDAEKMHIWLKETAKFEQTYLFTDTSPEIDDMSEPLPSQPTFTTLRRWLRKRFERPILSPSDSLWFFFSGHGVREQGQDYLLLNDSDPDPEEVNNSAISLAFVTEQLRQSGAGNIMMFVDACRSVAKSGLGIELQAEQGIISIASCRPEQKSYEIEELNHGSFTYALLESLQIQGENNCATVERLCKRLKDRVGTLNREYKKPPQTPYTRIEPETKNHLIFLPERIQPTRQDISTLRENALKAEIENDLNLAAFLWDRLVIHDRDEALKNLRRIWNKLQQTQISTPLFISANEQKSSGDFNFFSLHRSLKLQKWESADYATQRVIYKLANQEGKSQLDEEDIRSIPLNALSSLDQLWMNYSDGRFGFNVQRQIWLEEGGKIDSETLLRVSERVGWKRKNGFLNYGELCFNLNAPKGQFPVIWSSGSWIVAGLGSINSLILLDHFNKLFD
jgi:uncharacterized caspase-like protein